MASPSSTYLRMRRVLLERIEAAGLDPGDPTVLGPLVDGIVTDHEREAGLGKEGVSPLRDPGEMKKRLTSSVGGFGPLEDILASPGVEEIFLEDDRISFVDGEGRLRSGEVPTSSAELRHLVGRLLSATDRHLDVSNPIVQARVLEGTARLTAVVPPVADHLSATIRRFALRRESLSGLVGLESLPDAAAAFLHLMMQVQSSFLVSGPPGAGKTSMLAALLESVPAAQCVRCVEEVRELHVDLSPTSSYYEARPPGADGRGEVTLRSLVKLVLAMRPDRIVVGEVRGAEAFELTRAANAGCGFCCTVHANSARDALEALVNAALMAGENVTESVVRRVFSSSIDFVVHLDRDPAATDRGLRRRTMEILAVRPSLGDGFTSEPIFVREGIGGRMEWTGTLPGGSVAARAAAVLPAGVELRDICAGDAAL